MAFSFVNKKPSCDMRTSITGNCPHCSAAPEEARTDGTKLNRHNTKVKEEKPFNLQHSENIKHFTF